MTKPIAVVDASLVIKAILPNPELSICQEVLARLQDHQLAAPALWMYEITSTIAKAVRFDQLNHQEGEAALNQALTLGVQIILPDETQCQMAFEQTLEINRAAACDSFYLVIAEALQGEFWTADRRLARSFQGEKPTWIHTIDELSSTG